jgi:hypothetical protein
MNDEDASEPSSGLLALAALPVRIGLLTMLFGFLWMLVLAAGRAQRS